MKQIILPILLSKISEMSFSEWFEKTPTLTADSLSEVREDTNHGGAMVAHSPFS